MFHKAIELRFLAGTTLEMKFQTGEVKNYDVSALFPKYPQMKALQNRELFCSGRLLGAYGIYWNDELDLEAETVYEDGETVRNEAAAPHTAVGAALQSARAEAGLSQKELAEASGIDQSDISKIERGVANPSLNTLNRIAAALHRGLAVAFVPME